MKKAFGLFVFGLVALAVLSGLGSAYYSNGGYYYGNNYGDSYDDYHSYTSRTSGYGPMRTTRTTNYDRTTEKYWNGREMVDRTVYVRESRESPQYSRQNYGYDYGYGNYDYGRYNDYKPCKAYRDTGQAEQTGH